REGLGRDALLQLVIERAVRVPEVKSVRDPAERLGVAEEEVPAGRERARETSHDGARGFRSEIDEDVAEEDRVEGSRPPEARVVLEEVPLLERDAPARLFRKNVLATFGAEPASADRVVGLAQRPRREARAPRSLEDRRVDVDPRDRD